MTHEPPRRPHEELVSFTGRRAVDAQLEPLGKVTDVLYGEVSSDPRWAVVKTGLLGGEHLVPLANTYIDQDGRLVLPFDKNTVKHAPKPRGEHVLTRELAEELQQYWGAAA